MGTETKDIAMTDPSRFTTAWCRIDSCGRPVDGNVGGRYCAVHRRTFAFSAALNDALTEFLGETNGAMKPTDDNRDDIREAGAHFARGLSKLFGAAFGGATVAVEPAPITAKRTGGKHGGPLRWHVSFQWQELEDESTRYRADENDELDDYEDADSDENDELDEHDYDGDDGNDGDDGDDGDDDD